MQFEELHQSVEALAFVSQISFQFLTGDLSSVDRSGQGLEKRHSAPHWELSLVGYPPHSLSLRYQE
jgi:hypothetical protein